MKSFSINIQNFMVLNHYFGWRSTGLVHYTVTRVFRRKLIPQKFKSRLTPCGYIFCRTSGATETIFPSTSAILWSLISISVFFLRWFAPLFIHIKISISPFWWICNNWSASLHMLQCIPIIEVYMLPWMYVKWNNLTLELFSY